jgi:hypothetical protein
LGNGVVVFDRKTVRNGGSLALLADNKAKGRQVALCLDKQLIGANPRDSFNANVPCDFEGK